MTTWKKTPATVTTIEFLPPVQMPQRGVGKVVKEVQGNSTDTAYRQVTFAVRGDAAAGKDMGHRHGDDRLPLRSPALNIRPDPADGLAHHTGMVRNVNAELRGGQPRLKIGNAVDGHGSTAVLRQQDRFRDQIGRAHV